MSETNNRARSESTSSSLNPASSAEKSPGTRKISRRINLLPADLVNQIAAGEVIERPASVVKELVENSLDAGARRLLIELEDGGKTLVRISDDGAGIAAEDLPLAIQNHATSKLQTLPDLFEIATLGFRGEALASISSVSQLRIQSRPANKTASEIRVEGGKVHPVKACALPPGTRLEVRNLFFNVPARRKFLKSDRSEMTAVTQQLTRLALSRPEVHIQLRHNDKSVLDVPPSDEPRERIARLTTSVIAQEIIPVGPRQSHKVELELRGYISPFNITRADTRGQHFFVNARAIRDPLLLSAVKDSYLHLLPPRRHPYAFLWLDLDPRDIDVNVHPTKSEVRFRYSSDVYALIVSTLKGALSELAEPPPLLSPQKNAQVQTDPRTQSPASSKQPQTFNFQNQPQNQAMTPLPSQARPNPSNTASPAPDPTARPKPASPHDHLTAQSAEPRQSNTKTTHSKPQATPPNRQHRDVPYGRFVQLHNSFIIEETSDGLKIIDQHAIHERILYNQIVQRISRGPLETQRLLFPMTEPIDVAMTVIYAEIEPILRELGFEMSLQDQTLSIASIPSFVKPDKAPQIVIDLLAEKHPSFVNDEVQALDKAVLNSKAFETEEGRTMLHVLASSLACKAAIKFGMPLTHDEIRALLEARQNLERAYCCPHGRPTTLSLSISELRRRFGRPA